ncbi:heparinase II/III domain-containing protein [Geminisphaera colitermitum]|uniref:heparinase II/III domain-containing protein n=1 Tax=Geminisphaera colitermitum TaxID=1148786 RepID=UPI0009DEE1C7|nr:heparinase II/III family protein [Geminisphaera colitermitum]
MAALPPVISLPLHPPAPPPPTYGTPNLFSGKYAVEELRALLVSRADWKPFPTIDDRDAWARSNPQMLGEALREADALLARAYSWPALPATHALAYTRTGERNLYQKNAYEKRRVLALMLLAEIHENKGRFIDSIINGVWSICEETFWGSPAHAEGLPDITLTNIDLYTAETAALLAWTDYFLSPRFDAVSPRIRTRIRAEIDRRVLTPLHEVRYPLPHNLWWMLKSKNGRRPNNWTPWICSNWINAILLIETDGQRRAEMISRALGILDNYVNAHPLDGGCDEGPSYWDAAAAAVYDATALLNLATRDGHEGFRYVYQNEKIRDMARYIYRAQISGNYFVNFADARPVVYVDSALAWRFGRDIGDRDMQRFALSQRRPDAASRFEGLFNRHSSRLFFELFLGDAFHASSSPPPPLPQTTWLPDLQVMIAREKAGSDQGFFVAAKGGHNDESHNHNDVGNVIVYHDGAPVLIDVGRGTYTRRTFNEERYTLWFVRSEYHNVPAINGHEQRAGMSFRAREVSFAEEGAERVRMTMDIAPAYPAEARVEKWQRTVLLHRGEAVTIEDAVKLSTPSANVDRSAVWHFMTCHPARVAKPGEVIIPMPNADAGGTARWFVLHYDARRIEASIEKLELTQPEDVELRQHWGDSLYRINLKAISPGADDSFRFRITSGDKDD